MIDSESSVSAANAPRKDDLKVEEQTIDAHKVAHSNLPEENIEFERSELEHRKADIEKSLTSSPHIAHMNTIPKEHAKTDSKDSTVDQKS
jgi:hypothetical protein